MKKIISLLIILLLVGCIKKEEEKFLEEKKEEQNMEEKKELTIEDYQNNKVDELGEIPIMMYHGIHNKNNNDTEYTGGNVDKDGYQRTSEAFKSDLEFYYNEGYRMIRLTDYVDGDIDVELGKSPIILTFDDGLSNNIKVTGLDENGDIIIDPNSVVGILESFKEKYPDYNVTATFFINGGLFQQEEYNEKILNWLVDNGYDIGNHTYSHVDFTNVDSNKSQEEVGRIYELLDEIIPDKYVNIVALPFGSPYSLEHDNMSYIFNTSYNDKNYETKSTLRVGWKAESSPFSSEFNPKFLKRIRAYDNNGKEFDIEMNFNLLKKTRYISDGDEDIIVIPSTKLDLLSNNIKKEIKTY
ncbi:MAG: hypothetical protein E7174_00960 [Firmicutes bacterium]|nr:hypothetical protein [Bacillota bacterium]